MAKVNFYPGVGRTGHFSIEVTDGTAVQHMHLMPFDGEAMVSSVSPDGLPQPAMSHTFDLPDAGAALKYMRDQAPTTG